VIAIPLSGFVPSKWQLREEEGVWADEQLPERVESKKQKIKLPIETNWDVWITNILL
jgi:hypothetical protein